MTAQRKQAAQSGAGAGKRAQERRVAQLWAPLKIPQAEQRLSHSDRIEKERRQAPSPSELNKKTKRFYFRGSDSHCHEEWLVGCGSLHKLDYGQRVFTIYYPFGDRHVCPAKIPALAFDKHVVMIERHSRPYLSPILSDHHPAIYGEARGPVPRLSGQAGMQGHLFLSSSALSQALVEADHGFKIAILGKANLHNQTINTRLCASTNSAILAIE